MSGLDAAVEQLEGLAVELEQVASRLRSGADDPAAAAGLVERCAELANRLSAELERGARLAGEPPSAQERLL